VNRSISLAALLALSGIFAAAQQAANPAGFSSASEPHLTAPKVDGAKVLAGVSASHYHPDDLTEMDCGAVIDWESVMKQLKQTGAPDRMKVLDGMNVELRAQRNKPAMVRVTWANGEPTNKQTIEQGSQQMLGGFFQMYWTVFASALKPSQASSMHIDPRDDGGYAIHNATNSTEFGFNVDRELVPTKVYVKSPSMNVDSTLTFTPAPDPVPGDLRWLTHIDSTITVGTNVTNSTFDIEYQTLGGFHVPKRISIGVGGAYTVPIELIGCSVSRELTVSPPPK
jgi:hypothetical protein